MSKLKWYDQNKVIDYIYAGKNHERKRGNIGRKFKLTANKVLNLLDQLTSDFAIYENDTGKTVGLLHNRYIGKNNDIT